MDSVSDEGISTPPVERVPDLTASNYGTHLIHSKLEQVERGLGESARATVAAWTRLEETVGTLAISAEGWRDNVGQSSLKTEGKLLRALEALEERIHDLEQSHSAAVAGLATRFAGIEATGTHTQEWLESAASALARDIQGGLVKLREIGESAGQTTSFVSDLKSDSVQMASELQAMINAKLDRFDLTLTEAMAARIGTNAVLEDSISYLRRLLEEWKSGISESSSKTEGRLLRALEALEEGIARGQEQGVILRDEMNGLSSALSVEVEQAALKQQHFLGQAISELHINLMGTIESKFGAIGGAADRAEAGEGLSNPVLVRQQALETALEHLSSNIDDWRARGREAAQASKNRLAASIEALEIRILDTQHSGMEHQERLSEEISAVAGALQRLETRTRELGRNATIMRGLEELDEGVLETKQTVAGLAAVFEAQLESFESRVADAVIRKLKALEGSDRDGTDSPPGRESKNRRR